MNNLLFKYIFKFSIINCNLIKFLIKKKKTTKVSIDNCGISLKMKPQLSIETSI